MLFDDPLGLLRPRSHTARYGLGQLFLYLSHSRLGIAPVLKNWSDAQAGVAEVEKELAQAVASGVAAGSEEAQGIVEKHREALSAFFPVTPAKHFLISRGYVADERFRAHYETQQEGLAQWLADAIEHAAKAQGVDTDNPEWA